MPDISLSWHYAGCDGHGPCIHGTCEQAANGTYFCNCEEGWYGPECDVPGRLLLLTIRSLLSLIWLFMRVCFFTTSDILGTRL